MLIIPAIDLQDGCVVRFVQGRRDKKIYSRDPLKTARHWIKQGAKLLHIVDLDGAFTGEPKNLNIVKEIASSVNVPIEFGGGIRNLNTAKIILQFGVQRVVIGTKAVSDKTFLKKILSQFKDRVIVSIDAKNGKVLIEGWQAGYKSLDTSTFALALKEIGCVQVIYTDTLKDGTLSGPNIKATRNLLKETGLKVIASGGISTLNDIRKLKKLENLGLTGIIIGKALYEGRFTLAEALKLA